jgi:hypothetical protein
MDIIRRLFGLLRVPESSWTDEEKKFFREIQTLIQEHQKEIGSGQRGLPEVPEAQGSSLQRQGDCISHRLRVHQQTPHL